MTFTRNKLDTNNTTLLNKLVEFGGDITYSTGFYIWNTGMTFHTIVEMKQFMENNNE